MPVDNGDTVRITLTFRLAQNTLAQNVFHWRLNSGGPVSNSAMVNEALAWVGDWGTKWAGMATTDSTLVALEVHTVSGPGLTQFIGDAILNIIGLRPNKDLPQGDAAVMRARVSGSNGQARKFLAGISEDDQEAGIISALPLVQMLQMGQLWVSAWTQAAGTTLDMTPGVYNVVVQAFREMAGGFFVNQIIGYQRRRKEGVGL
jgi:hypothetical protein